jgi:hypothetical protein
MEEEIIQINLKHEVVDESFEHGMTERAAFVATLDEHQFCYFILDLARRKVVVMKDYHIIQGSGTSLGFFKSIIEQDEILGNLQAEKIIFGIHSNCSTFIPDPLFSKDHMEEALKLVCRPEASDNIYEDHIKIADTHLIYNVPESFLKETGDIFKEAILFNAKSNFIEMQLMMNKHRQLPFLAVNVRKHKMDILVCKGNELLFCNTFEQHTGEDFIYYLLYVMEQMQLSPDVNQVMVYGEIDRNSSAWLVAQKYIRYISLGEKPDNIEYSYGFSNISSSQYHLLFTQALCVL